MREIVAARAAGGPYRSVADRAARVRLARDESENQAMAGALDSLAGNRPTALWQVHEILSSPQAASPLLESAGGAAESPPAPALPDYSPLQKLQVEEYVLGMTPSANPMEVYRPLIEENDYSSPPRKRRGIFRTSDLMHRAGEQVAVAGVLFAERRARTKTGEFMKFISLEDECGVVEAVLLPDAYQRLGGRITTRGPYLVIGTVENHMGAVSLMVSDLRLMKVVEELEPAAAR